MAISGISVTEDNYDVVVALLKDKFGSKESTVETLYARLYHLPTSSSRFNDIKYTYNNVERLLRQLESQGEAIKWTKNVNLSDTEQVSCRCCGQTRGC